jgi:hypothetical protein
MLKTMMDTPPAQTRQPVLDSPGGAQMGRSLQVKRSRGKRRASTGRRRLKFSSPLGMGWIPGAVLMLMAAQWQVFISPANAQPLDDVITNLLDDSGGVGLCTNLTGAGAVPAAGGELDDYCTQGGSGTTSSTGGGASTPQTTPDIVQERLQAVREDRAEAPKSENSSVAELIPSWSVFLSAEGETLDSDWPLPIPTMKEILRVGVTLTMIHMDSSLLPPLSPMKRCSFKRWWATPGKSMSVAVRSPHPLKILGAV